MDVYCQKCGEPWDFFYFTDEEPENKKRFYNGEGCPSCNWGATAPAKRPFRSEVTAALRDILGDDIDGIASELQDAEAMMPNFFGGGDPGEDGDEEPAAGVAAAPAPDSPALHG
jgi:hypothetical protein